MERGQELNLKEIQEVNFEILKKFKEIFDENGWKYYLAYGTLLGAIRHEGYIPWDDDVDVWVPRPDYEKFIKYAQENTDKLKPFELIHYSTNENYVYPIARFSNSNYIVEYNTVKDYGLGVFIDVYPLDGINPNDKKYLKKIKRINRRISLLGNKKYIKSKSLIKNILKYPYYLMIKNMNLQKQIEKNDMLSQKYKIEEEWFGCISWEPNFLYKRKWLEEEKESYKNFNGEKFRVPTNYDEILKIDYGDYMKLPPRAQQKPHHNYKVYKVKK